MANQLISNIHKAKTLSGSVPSTTEKKNHDENYKLPVPNGRVPLRL